MLYFLLKGDFYMYTYNYDTANTISELLNSALWVGVAFVFAIFGGIFLYFVFLKNDTKYDNKFLNWLKDFFDFKKLFLESILKITYLIVTVFIILISFNLIKTGILAFVIFLLVGLLVSRLVYELILMKVIICKNTTEINDKLSKMEDKKITTEKSKKSSEKKAEES